MADSGDPIPQYVPDYTWTAAKPTSNIASGATVQVFKPTTVKPPPPDGNTDGGETLPEDFDPFQHLQAVYLPQHNAAVASFFSDLGQTWQPNIGNARSSLRVACTMITGENELMTAMRHRLFYDLLGYGNSNLIVYNGSRNDIAPPVDGHPKICFYFSQDAASVPHGQTALDAEYSFRIMTETYATINKTKLTTLATLIKEFFVVGGLGIQFTKGKNIYRYNDPVHGYRLMIYANQQTDALPIIQAMLECQEVTYNINSLTSHESNVDNIDPPAQILVYGTEVTPAKYRPIANVRFRYAYAEIANKKKPVYLVDTTGRYIPLVH